MRWLATWILLTASSSSYPGAFFKLESDLLSEPEPLKTTVEDWGEGFGSGERQWLVSSAEIGLRYKGFEISVQQRAQADLRLNSEAAVFFGQLSRKESLVPGRSVPVHVQVNGFTAQGVRLGYRYESVDWMLGVSAARLQAAHLMSGSLDGNFTATATQDFDFDATVDYYYYRDPIFGRRNVREPEGEGWSVRVLGEWRLNDFVQISAEIDDLFAEIEWEDAPFTQAQAHTDRKRYDAEGYAIFDPFLSGLEGYADTYEQDLDPRYHVEAEVGSGPWTAHMEARRQFGYNFAGYGLGSGSGETTWKALYWPQLEAIGFELNWQDFIFGLTLDNVAPDEVQYASLSVSYGYK